MDNGAATSSLSGRKRKDAPDPGTPNRDSTNNPAPDGVFLPTTAKELERAQRDVRKTQREDEKVLSRLEKERRKREEEEAKALKEGLEKRKKALRLLFTKKAALDIMEARECTTNNNPPPRLEYGLMKKVIARWQTVARGAIVGDDPTVYIKRDKIMYYVRDIIGTTEKRLVLIEAFRAEVHLLNEQTKNALGLKKPPPPAPAATPPIATAAAPGTTVPVDVVNVPLLLGTPTTTGGTTAVSSLTGPPTTQTIVQQDENDAARKKGGRPKGAKRQYLLENEKKRLVAVATEASAKQFLVEQEELGEGKRMPRGRIHQIMLDEAKKLDLTPSRLKKRTIINRVQRENVSGVKESTISPMTEIEPIIAEYCVRLGRMREPLDKDGVIQLAKDLIKDTRHESKLIEWRRRFGFQDDDTTPLIGRGWYQKFLKRFKDKLKCVIAFVKDNQRATWNTWYHYNNMYNHIYNRMVDARVARLRDAEVYVNKVGDIVLSEEDSYGLPTQFAVTVPQYIIFADEAGANTNQKEDGQVGQRKFVVDKNQKETGKKGAVQDMHFTTICFQASTGEPVMVAIIMKSDKESATDLPVGWTAGIDISKEIHIGATDAETWKLNSNPGGAMGGGPTCDFRGKTVPCFIGASPKASITSELLKQMLKRMDDLEIFERVDGGPIPFLLVDGHHSRLELPFLDYVNTPATEWVVTMGVPYGSHHWQVADSSECNGCYKMGITKGKQEIYDLKPEDDKVWKPTDVIPIVNKGFERSFANKVNVQKAIAERGWGPLNYALLLHPDILATKDVKQPAEEQQEEAPAAEGQQAESLQQSNSSNTVLTSTVELNLSKGTSSSLMTKLVREEMKKEGRLRVLEEEQKEAEDRRGQVNVLKKVGRWTSGSLASQNWFSLDSSVRDAVQLDMNEKKEEEAAAQEKRDEKEKKAREKYDLAKEKEGSGAALTSEDLRTICRLERSEEDPKMTGMNVASLRALYEVIKARRSPPAVAPARTAAASEVLTASAALATAPAGAPEALVDTNPST